jgi:predicted Zn finger-like uncharacterized protein
MNIECPNCKKTGQVDDAKIPVSGVHAVCPQCNEKFLVKLDKPKDFEFQSVEEPISNISKNDINSNKLSMSQSPSKTLGKRYLGVLPSVLISAVLAFIVSIALFVLFTVLTNSKLSTTTHGLVFICCFLISYQLLRERTFPTITVLSIVGGYIFFYVIVSIVIHTSNKPKLPNTPQQQAQTNQSVQIQPAQTAPTREPAEFIFSDSTALDTKTGLIWTRNAKLGNYMNRKEAPAWVSQLNYGGFNNWRLPTKEELEYLYKRGGSNPPAYFNALGFVDVQCAFYWSSSSENSYGRSLPLKVSMCNGLVLPESNDFNSYYVWPVRSQEN